MVNGELVRRARQSERAGGAGPLGFALRIDVNRDNKQFASVLGKCGIQDRGCGPFFHVKCSSTGTVHSARGRFCDAPPPHGCWRAQKWKEKETLAACVEPNYTAVADRKRSKAGRQHGRGVPRAKKQARCVACRERVSRPARAKLACVNVGEGDFFSFFFFAPADVVFFSWFFAFFRRPG